MAGILDPDYDIFGNKIKKRRNSNPLGLNSLWGSTNKNANKRDARRQISRSEKNEVLARQHNRCNICKKGLDPRAIHFDHIKEYSKGGKTDISNIQALCPTCHAKKTNRDRVNEIRQKRALKKEKEDYWVNPITGLKERRPPRLF